MKRTFFLHFILCLLALPTTSVHAYHQLDSLQQLLSHESTPQKQLDIYKEIMVFMKVTDSIKAHEYISRGTEIAKQLNDVKSVYFFEVWNYRLLREKGDATTALEGYERLLAESQKEGLRSVELQVRMELGETYRVLKRLQDSADLLNEVLRGYQSLGDTIQQVQCYQYLGLTYDALYQYDLALLSYQTALNLLERVPNLQLQAHIYAAMAASYYSQNSFTNSLVTYQKAIVLFKLLEDPIALSNCYQGIGRGYRKQRKAEEAIYYFRQALHTKEEASITYEIDRQLGGLGLLYFKVDKEDSAFHYLNRAFAIYEKTNGITWIASLKQSIGSYYFSKGKVPEALEYYYEALKLAEKSGNPLIRVALYTSLARVKEFEGKHEETLAYYQKALPVAKEAGNLTYIAVVQQNIASGLANIGEHKSSLFYGKEALASLQALKDTCMFGLALEGIGHAYYGLDSLDAAIVYFKEAIYYNEQCDYYGSIGHQYMMLGELSSKQGNHQQAFSSYQQAFHYVERLNDKKGMMDVARHLYPLYKERGDYESAFDMLYIYQVNKDSLFNEENTRKLVEKELEYEHEKELLAKELTATATLEKQQWITYGVIVACVFLVALSLAIYRNYQNKNKANQLLNQQKEQIEAQNSLLKEQKVALENLDETKSRFFANISHELRTPLTLISSPLQAFMKQTKEILPEASVNLLSMMKRNSDQLSQLVNDILALSKLEANRIELKEEPVAIKPLLGRLFANFESLAQQLGIHYVLEIAAIPDVWVSLDIEKFTRIVNNLLSNAIKHTARDGRICLKANVIQARFSLQVEDTGAGIAKEDLPFIFERFYQSKQPDAPIQGGTGIGLALVKELSQFMKGDITVESTLGVGSVFSLTLPFTTSAQPDVENERSVMDTESELVEEESIPLATQEVKLEDYRVLIVEDHPDMQRFINSLVSMQYDTLVARNGKQALELLEKEKIDLIISDVMMPEMDGYQLLDSLKSSDAYRHIPVVMLTALNSDESKLQALTIGVDDYMTKPFSPEELMARVHNLLKRNLGRKEWQTEELAPATEGEVVEQVQETDSVAQEILLTADELTWIKQVEKTIEQELENDQFSIQALAEEYHLSLRQFRRKVKKITGMSPKQYQQEVALQKARRLLESGEYTYTTAVCYSIGMKHVTRFAKLYEARFGKKPNAYFETL